MKINLKDYYPTGCNRDMFIEIDESIVAEMRTVLQERQTWNRRIRRNGLISFEEYESRVSIQPKKYHAEPNSFEESLVLRIDLMRAMNKLTYVQARRVYKHFFLGMSKTEIALNEGVSASSVKDSIRLGLARLNELLK